MLTGMRKNARAVGVVLSLSVWVWLGGTARADGAPETQRLGVDLGIASAVGELGVTYQAALQPWMRIEAGLGYGFTGAQLSVMPKLAFGGDVCRFTAGFGASLAVGGAHAEEGPLHEPHRDVIPWLNLDVPGIECRSRSGFSFQAALGVTMTMVDFHYDFADTGKTVDAGEMLPQARAGLGWWF
jgi:hypothetical protein